MAQSVIIQWGNLQPVRLGDLRPQSRHSNWAGDDAIEAVCASPFNTDQIAVDALRERTLLPFLVRSVNFQSQLKRILQRLGNRRGAPMLMGARQRPERSSRAPTTSRSKASRRSA